MIDSLVPGKKLMFRGKLYSVSDVSTEFGTVWLQPEPRKDGVCVGVYGTALILREASPLADADFIPKHTKAEIDARIDELQRLRDEAHGAALTVHGVYCAVDARIQRLTEERDQALDDIFSSIVESHKVLCHIKQMGEKEAYGQDPAFYYGSAVSGEAGEMVNKMVKALRGGGDATDKLRAAVLSELPDVVIYAFVLAYVLDIDLTRLVTEKAQVVVERARSGYYGGPLWRPPPADSPKCPTCSRQPRGP